MSALREGARLSSRWTLMHRIVVPLLLLIVGGGGVAALALAVSLGIARIEMLLTAAAGLIAALAVAGSLALHLRTVEWTGGHLRVSGLRREWSIPPELIEGVQETRLIRPKLIRIRLRARPGMPDSVLFLAPSVPRLPLRPHPVVRDLRRVTGIRE